MNPLGRKGSTVKRTEWSVRGKAKGLGLGTSVYTKVRADRDSKRIIVHWLNSCAGGTRSFTAEDLLQMIGYIDGPLRTYPEMWLNIKDSDKHAFYVHVEDGRLTANETAAEYGSVSWDDLKNAFQEAMDEINNPDPDEEEIPA